MKGVDTMRLGFRENVMWGRREAGQDLVRGCIGIYMELQGMALGCLSWRCRRKMDGTVFGKF